MGFHWLYSLIWEEEGNGNPLQCSCLENPRDGGAWWAAIYGVAQSRTRLKRLSSSSSRHLNGLPGGSAVKNPSNCNAGDAGSIPGLGRSPAEGNGYPLQYYWPPNRMDRGTDRLQCMGLQKSQTRLKRLSSSSSRHVMLVRMLYLKMFIDVS